MADASLPTQVAIDEARTLLTEARKRVGKIKKVDDQVKDKDLLDITKLLYGRIPKVKPVGAAPETWVLSLGQHPVLGARPGCLRVGPVHESRKIEVEDNPYGDMRIELEWLDPKSKVGASSCTTGGRRRARTPTTASAR
jgi:hypothetical protein